MAKLQEKQQTLESQEPIHSEVEVVKKQLEENKVNYFLMKANNKISPVYQSTVPLCVCVCVFIVKFKGNVSLIVTMVFFYSFMFCQLVCDSKALPQIDANLILQDIDN